MVLECAGSCWAVALICRRSLLIVSFHIDWALGWLHCVVQCCTESGSAHSEHLEVSACSAGSSLIALAWFRPCQCLSKSRRLQSNLLVVFVVSCHSSLANGMLRACLIGGSSAFSLYSSRVSRHALSLLRCMESINDLDVYCLPVLPKYRWLCGDSKEVSVDVSICKILTMFKIVAELLLYYYVGTWSELEAVLSSRWFPHIFLVQRASWDWVPSVCPLIHCSWYLLFFRWCSAVVSNVESTVVARSAVVEFSRAWLIF